MKVAIIVGSVRTGRQSHKVAYYLEEVLKKRGVETNVLDLAKETLPILGDGTEQHLQLPEKIQAISVRLQKSDAFLFITPEYHGSFSGVLKNALDYFWSEFHKKPIGVVTVSTGKLGGINASTQLQHVVLSLGAFALPTKLLVPEVHTAFDEGQFIHERISKSAEKFLDEYLWFAQAIVQAKQSTVNV